MPITSEKLLELKSANAGLELHLLENPITDDAIVCKSPGAEWTRYLSESEGKQHVAVHAARKTLIVCCAVYPPREEVERMLAERPGLAGTFTGELGEIAGSTLKATHRKL